MTALHSIISLLLTGLYLLVVAWLIKGWAALKRPNTGAAGLTTKVTILIAARDEAERIHLTINDIIAQDYPRHLTEIIIVDDHSTDGTAEIISSYAAHGVKLLQLNEDKPLNSYKKKAISEAIGLSTGELMVCTDADCRMGTEWLSSIVGYYETHQPVMISSPVSYFEETTLFERLQTLEFSYLIGIGAAFIGNGRASTCNGANFAYRKDVFYEVGGFKGIDDLASGDDELLLQKVAEIYPARIGFFKNRDAVVYTHAKHTLQEFLQQRRRWASKSTRYKDKTVVALAVCIWLFNLSLLVNAGLGFYSIFYFKLFLVQFLLKYLIEVAFLLPITAFFKRTSLVGLLIILAPIHIIYFVYVGLIGNTRKYAWKGRVVR
ncbi:glycosyltransferase family 2 protein [Mucilaginibacter phyllosphaerae]|uniref:Glycosyltransferase n=1 Tax=Mucilaginibacter phyllosphaerae TaxID=1812349 RepID=A0A4Y8ACS5_9SPHI|nr:glycosyltransferase [Mucilaginibacter phyllosphaerae]MBB3970031.1 cellulose synthase/poly-beta-1,6-N-acetylglucosamine synthase-like glycosyltransferase [Mucilaginibacter phyllosphaerae]TEW66426.1 glycosyltransferase [Mucilaginibacter phyllosphaerae]GGH09276.1 glycosyl transferase [Mucilaginibacter phyllosphaerae]